jgi:hypothetical protein
MNTKSVSLESLSLRELSDGESEKVRGGWVWESDNGFKFTGKGDLKAEGSHAVTGVSDLRKSEDTNRKWLFAQLNVHMKHGMLSVNVYEHGSTELQGFVGGLVTGKQLS